jgi:hypothetical protein
MIIGKKKSKFTLKIMKYVKLFAIKKCYILYKNIKYFVLKQ